MGLPPMTRTEPVWTAARAEPVPALTVVVSRGRDLLEQRRPGLAAFAALVAIDPVLTGALSRIVRCPLYGIEARDLSLERSIELVGRSALVRILDALPVAEDDVHGAIDAACRRWMHGIAVAAAARWIANQGHFEAPEEAYLAGLVHSAGCLGAPAGEDPRTGALRTEAVVRTWRLSARIAAVARWHHALAEGVSVEALVAGGNDLDPPTRRLLDVIARASRLASALDYGAVDGTLDSDNDDPYATPVREAIELEIAHAADVLGMPAAPPLEFASLLIGREIRARYDDDAAEATFVVSQARTAARVAALHREVIDTRGMTAIGDMLDRGLREIHEKLEFDRLILLEHDPSKLSSLRSRLVLDPTHIEFERGLGGVEIPADRGGALLRALDTELPSHGEDATLDRRTLDFLGVGSFAAAPLRAGPANLGVVVADQFLTGRPVSEGDAAVLAMLCSALGLAMENAALEEATKKLRGLAEKDELTGINNRRNILEVLQREIDRARRYGKPLSLAMVDVDHFKSWNDLYGHQTGDMVLASVAQLISSCSREIDSYGRYGGEEFLIVLPETPVDHAILYAERLRTTIEAHGESLVPRFPGTSLSVSVGLSALSPRGDDADKLIHRADSALYAAKNHGRNRVCVEVPNSEAPKPPAPPHSRGVLDEL